MLHKIIQTFKSFGYDIIVAIDFDKQTISLLNEKFEPKYWIFNERTIEYTRGWLMIFKAIEHAVEEAQKILETELKKR